jgi:hypothetical protein
MLRCKGSYRDVRIFIYDTRDDLVRIHFMTVLKRSLIAIGVGARIYVRPVRFEQVLRHGFEAFGSVDFHRLAPTKRPWRKDQIWIPDRVVGMQVRREGNSQSGGLESRDASAGRSGACTANDPRSEVN